MNAEEREDRATAAREKCGWDFFMVDPRGGAAPFRIENMKDMAIFVEFASPWIDWQASHAGAVIKTALSEKIKALERMVGYAEASESSDNDSAIEETPREQGLPSGIGREEHVDSSED